MAYRDLIDARARLRQARSELAAAKTLLEMAEESADRAADKSRASGYPGDARDFDEIAASSEQGQKAMTALIDNIDKWVSTISNLPGIRGYLS